MSQKIDSVIQQAIQARMQRDWKSLARLCSKIESMALTAPLPKRALAHFEILKMASPEFEKNLMQIRHSLEMAKMRLGPLECHESFLFLFESSGFFIHSRNYSTALHLSLLAEEKSFDKNSWLSSYLNSLVCFEGLGIEFTDRFESIEREIKQSREKISSKAFHSLQLMKLRTWFRRGHFHLIQNYSGPDILYYKWLKSLPQFQRFRNWKFRDLNVSTDEAHSRFVLNTLLYRTEEEDLVNPPINYWCDRIYLWTWSMLKNPEKVPIAHLYWLLENCDFENKIDRMAVEDRIMISHSLKILTFFDPSSEKSLTILYQKLATLNYDYHPFLTAERLQIEEFKNKLNCLKADTLPRIKSFKGKIGSGNYSLSDSKHWPGLKHINRRLMSNNKTFKKVKIDLLHGRIDGPNATWCIYSREMAGAFELFLSHEFSSSIDLNDFVQSVFNFPYFDQFMHYRRVYNLLSRMKRTSEKEFSFKIREKAIHFDINTDHFMLVKNQSLEGEDPQRWRKIVFRIRINLSKKVDFKDLDKMGDIKSAFLLNDRCSREQIQLATGWNKTMATRRINKYLRENVLVKYGIGKATCYGYKVD